MSAAEKAALAEERALAAEAKFAEEGEVRLMSSRIVPIRFSPHPLIIIIISKLLLWLFCSYSAIMCDLQSKYLEEAKLHIKIPSESDEAKYDPSHPPLSPVNRRIASLKPSKGHSRTASGLFGVGQDLTKAFGLIVDAWMYFDVAGNGIISREEMQSVLVASHMKSPTKKFKKKASGHEFSSTPSDTFLTEERFKELDWDGDGNISFREFLFAFESWVGLDEEED